MMLHIFGQRSGLVCLVNGEDFVENAVRFYDCPKLSQIIFISQRTE
jgi:hypothetical protein